MANQHFFHSGGVNWALIAALAIGAFFLFGEHRVHALGGVAVPAAGGVSLAAFFHASRSWRPR